MPFLPKLSSPMPISEAMAFEDTDSAVATSLRESCRTTISSTNSNSISGATATSTATNTNNPVSPLDESLSGLGRTTESFLRMMRLDVVLLGSREEEMRSALVGLESQWEMLEQLLEEQKETTTAANTIDDSSQPLQKGVDNQIVTKRPIQITSTIDWDGDSDSEDEVEEKKKTNQNTLFTAKKNRAVRSKDPEKVSSQLANSNFDWGGDDDVQKAARRASLFSSTSGETVTKIINGTQIIEEEEEKQNNQKQPQNVVPILLRMFQPRNNKKSKERNGGKDCDVSATSASVNSKNSQEKGWWGRKRGVRNDDDSIATAASSVNKTNNEKKGWALVRTSVSTNEGSVNSDKPPPALFQLFGGRSKRQLLLNETQNNAISEEGSVNNAPISGGGRKGNSEDHTNNTNDDKTVETHPPSYCSETSSSHPVATKNNSKKSSTDPMDERIISSLQVKLRGCDSAASTLQQLLSYQTRHLFHLQYERNSLQSSSKFESSHSKQELEKLRNQLHFAKVERRRKSRFLEDAHKKKKRTQDQEELLKGELESIRTELFMLNNMQQMAERGGRGNTTTNDDGGGDFLGDSNRGMDGSGGHDRVVIVGGSSSQTATEWR